MTDEKLKYHSEQVIQFCKDGIVFVLILCGVALTCKWGVNWISKGGNEQKKSAQPTMIEKHPTTPRDSVATFDMSHVRHRAIAAQFTKHK